MSAILLILVGLSAGFVATKLMKVELSPIETAALGVLGALIGGFALRMALAASRILLRLAGAVIGASVLI